MPVSSHLSSQTHHSHFIPCCMQAFWEAQCGMSLARDDNCVPPLELSGTAQEQFHM